MIAAIIVTSVAVLLLLAAYLCYYLTFYSPHRNQNDIYNLPKGEQYDCYHPTMRQMIAEMDAVPFEQVFIQSHDGKKLTARFYFTEKDAPVGICFHGYRGTALREFCGGGMMCLNQGMNVLLVDQRSAGKSEGHTITFGVKERYDVLSWIDYAKERCGKDCNILLFGVSMGSATILMSTGLPLPENVKGIIADCPYSTPKEIISTVCTQLKLPPKPTYFLIQLGALIYGHFKPWEGNTVEAVKNMRIPTLIIHGEDDRFVPCQMSRRIAEANPMYITLETFPGAGHGVSYMTNKERYIGLVNQWIVENVKK